MVKTPTSASPEKLKEAQGQLAYAEAAIGQDLADIYVNPGAALKGMGKFMKDNSPEALVRKLESFPNYFGAMHAHLGEKNFLTPKGAGQRAKAKTLAKDLPGKVRDFHALGRHVAALETAVNGGGFRFPSGPKKDGPDFD